MKKFLLLFLCLLAIVRCGSDNNSACPDKTCNDYATQAQAQAAYDADRDCLGELDHDSDGIACEHLSTGGSGAGGGTSGCPTTSNCGCSGKTKNQCGGPCCQWIVGTGCKCK